MDDLNPQLSKVLAAKEARRRRLALARFPEKIATLVRLQELAAPIQRRKGLDVWPWRFESGGRVGDEEPANNNSDNDPTE